MILPAVIIAGFFLLDQIKKRIKTKIMPGYLTKNFKKSEFDSRDGAEMPPEVLENITKLAQNLQVLRDHLNKPIKINSGYRSPEYNARLRAKSSGVAKNSQHIKGRAADIVISGLTPRQVAQELEKLIAAGKILQGGIGIYPTFTHYDIRGNKARW